MKFSEKVKEAKSEAKRFLKRVADWEKVQGQTYNVKYRGFDETYHVNTPTQNGAVKRSSLDLTRSLADLRNYKK